jgi:hypothetical protein
MALLTGSGDGLRATYYNGGLDTAPVVSRIDPTLNFTWSGSSPDFRVKSTHFSAEWTGQIQAPESGQFTFMTHSDDGVRVWVNGQTLIDNWTIHSATENRGSIWLTAGQKYDIKVDYDQNLGDAIAQLFWSAPTIAKQIVPSQYLYASANPSRSAAALDPAFHDSNSSAPNDAHPAGVSSKNANWRSGYKNKPPVDWHSMTMWGVVYAADGWSPSQALNTRVQIKDAESWILSKSTGKWTEVQDADQVEGAAYVADFKNNVSKETWMKDESANGGGISVIAGNGYNFHFWTKRVDINPTDIAGVYTKFDARLVKHNPNGPDDRAEARYVASAAGDYWRSKSAPWASDWSNNSQIASGRYKWVTNDWRTFSMGTLPTDQMMNNPPPLD